MSRKFPRKIRRVVVKVGSSLLATYKLKPRTARLKSLVEQLSRLRNKGMDVVLVSSGAIVLGLGEQNAKTRPTDLPSLQASAAIGQTLLMNKYSEFFKSNKQKCAQVLLTWDDFDNRTRFNNARKTLDALFAAKAIPVINENDTISTDEIKFGDNDKLSALVASMIDADLLVILSDVEGFYQLSDGQKQVFSEIKEITKEIENLAGGTAKKTMAKGGMKAKLDAVTIAAHAKVPTIIASGRTPKVLDRILNKERIGTYFFEKEDKLLSRKHWISFGSTPKGEVIVDDGAKKALLKGGKSLLLPGIKRITGHFKKGDVVVVLDGKGHEIGRGVSNYSAVSFEKLEDKKGKEEFIHCNDLVLSER